MPPVTAGLCVATAHETMLKFIQIFLEVLINFADAKYFGRMFNGLIDYTRS